MTTTIHTRNQHTLAPAPSWLLAAAVVLSFLTLRFLNDGVVRSVAVATTLLLLGASVALRVVRGASSPEAKHYFRSMVVHQVGVALGLLVLIVDALHPQANTHAVLLSLGLVVVTVGVAGVAGLELIASDLRATGFIEVERVRAALRTSGTLSMALCALVALNYGVTKLDLRRDLSLYAPTTPSGATLSVLDAASCGDSKGKPEVFLFFERGSTAVHEIDGYFHGLAEHGAIVQTLDQALDPALSRDLKVSKNGIVGLRCGGRTDTLTIGSDRDDAKRALAKLDDDVRTRLAKLTRDERLAYFTVGHGERTLDDAGKNERAGSKSLKKLLETVNVRAHKLGLVDGLGSEIPKDAAIVVVNGPTQPFLPAEAQALALYAERGGALWLLIDPTLGDAPSVSQSLQPLWAVLGVHVDDVLLANDREFVAATHTPTDHSFLFTASFGNHKATKTLSGARGKAALLFLDAAAVVKDAPLPSMAKSAAKFETQVTPLAFSRPDTFGDKNQNRSFDDGSEKRGIVEFATAVEKPTADGKALRAVVVGDSDVATDTLLGSSDANAWFAYDACTWLLRDDAGAAGAVNGDEDIVIRHTRDGDTLWFYGTIFLVPALLLLTGTLVMRRRRRRRVRPASHEGRTR
jgi:hypothetical protein